MSNIRFYLSSEIPRFRYARFGLRAKASINKSRYFWEHMYLIQGNKILAGNFFSYGAYIEKETCETPTQAELRFATCTRCSPTRSRQTHGMLIQEAGQEWE